MSAVVERKKCCYCKCT